MITIFLLLMYLSFSLNLRLLLKDHDYTSISRYSHQPTKKLDCPAKVVIREIVFFPRYKVRLILFINRFSKFFKFVITVVHDNTYDIIVYARNFNFLLLFQGMGAEAKPHKHLLANVIPSILTFNTLKY